VIELATLLYIKANPKSDRESRTFQIAGDFIKSYQETHPQDKIITLDLYKENVKPLTSQEVILSHKNTSNEEPMIQYANQFHQTEKIVIAAPLWNLGIPSILKAYIDYIMIAGINFKYTESGPVGLCNGKKVIHITSRGGVYSQEPMSGFEMGDRYLRTVFGFLGITDFTTIAAEGLDIQGVDVQAILKKAQEDAVAKARTF
jgi:FMN-dependent NADH-azoreductase